MIPLPLCSLRSQDGSGAPAAAASGPSPGTHVGVDLGQAGAQVQHGGDGADGEANDLAPGEGLQGEQGPVVSAPRRTVWRVTRHTHHSTAATRTRATAACAAAAGPDRSLSSPRPSLAALG